MSRSIVAALCCLALLVTLAPAPVARAQGETGLQFVTEFPVPGSRDVKFPHVAAGRGAVHVVGTVSRSTATYWTKGEAATDFAAGFGLGPSEGGQPDYLNNSVTIAPDGAVYAAWTNLQQDRVYLRRRDTSGAWGPTRVVANANFPIFAEVGVASDGKVFVVWNEPGRSARYRVSSDQGASWSSTINLGDFLAFSDQMDVSTGPSGQVAVSWTGVSSGLLQVFVAFWNGSGFDIRRVSTLDANYADATVSYAPDGKVYVAWRGTDGGVFYSERQPDGNWPRSRLASSIAEGLVNVSADEAGNLHFSWIARPSGGPRLYYAFKEANGPFRGPLSSDSGGIFNPHASASAGAQIYNHVVMEEFTGSGQLRTLYMLWRAEGNIFAAQPNIEGGAAVTGGKSTVSVSFATRGGTPNQVRWRWGAEPTDAATDSGGWVSFSNPLPVPVPEAIRTSTSCQPVTLYTQTRSTTAGFTEDRAKSDAIIYDGVVEATGIVSNPYLFISDAAAPAELAGVAGALAGDPRYTRIPLMYLEIASGDDCSDLKSVGIGRSAESIETVIEVTDAGYRGFVPLPGIATLKDGPVPVTLQIKDGAGNTLTTSTTLIFDETKPVLNASASGGITAAPSPDGDLLQRLSFSNLVVDDGQSSGRGFWGVWLAVSRSPVANPAASDDLEWFAVPASGSSASFTVAEFSLASGLDADEVTPGTYYVYARALDGAGNASDQAISVAVVSQAQGPDLSLPLILR